MPTMHIRIPKGSFPTEQKTTLVQKLNDAAAAAEQMPDNPKNRAICWVILDEVEPDAWTFGAVDMTDRLVPCFAMIHVPAGVLDGAARARYVELVHAAFQQALPANEKRQAVTNVVLHDVAEGTWGANGKIWRLPDVTRAAGFMHLQSLVTVA